MKPTTRFSASILIIAAMLVGVFGALAPSRATVAPSVSAYLASLSPQTDWSVMAQSALDKEPADASFLKTVDGDTANDYATYILAIAALGEDPRAFGGENLVYGLRQKASNGQIGDPALMNDDIFGLLALTAAGVPQDDTLVTQTVQYIKNNQFADGSWDFTVDGSGDGGTTDMTAMAIMALIAAGVDPADDAIFDAADYLLFAQNDDGGFGMLPGEESNTASTAWALSAIHALGDEVYFWAPAGDTPEDYLAARLHEDGYFLFSAQSQGADQFTPVSTAYAAIALAGNAYPVASISAPPSVNLRIEGQSLTICDTSAQGRTALDAIKSAASGCGYEYMIEDTDFGPYLTTIAGETAAGTDGWSYLPNYERPDVGASAYAMSEGDELIWYYGAWDDKPLRVVHDQATVAAGDTTTAVVQEYADGSWQPYADGSLSRGSETFTSDANGQVSLSWSQNGTYYLVAEADGHVRSDAVLVVSGEAGEQASLPLSANISTEAGAGPGSDPAPEPGGVSFGVSGDLSFGTLAPGSAATKQATLSNNASGGITTTASVSGSSLFTNHLTLDNVIPGQWQKAISASAQASVDVTLSVPSSYAGVGSESGTLTFWAHASN